MGTRDDGVGRGVRAVALPGLSGRTDGLLAQFVDAGYAVAATDYEGLGTPGPHAYLIGNSEARGVMTRSARRE